MDYQFINDEPKVIEYLDERRCDLNCKNIEIKWHEKDRRLYIQCKMMAKPIRLNIELSNDGYDMYFDVIRNIKCIKKNKDTNND